MTERIDWISILQLGFSILAALVCWFFAFLFGLTGVMELFSAQALSEQTASFFLLAAGAGFSGLLLLPSAGYAFLGLLKRPFPVIEALERAARRFVRPTLLILLLPLVLLIGYQVSQNMQLAWLALPGLHILAVGLPILWLGYLGWRELPAGSSQRAWGIFGTGLILGPSVILVLEIAALGVLLSLGVVYVALNPELAQELEVLAFRVQFSANSPEDVLPLISPYLARPLVLFAIFTFIAVLVPLIEEIFKPIGVWLFVGKGITPAEGFVAGLLSGSGYALFESLALSTAFGGNWAEVVVPRIGTGLLHILTTGLTGWALALAWKEGRYLRLGITYMGVVVLHGLWNGLALLTAASDFSAAGAIGAMRFEQLSRAAVIGLGVVALGMFAILLFSNSMLRRAQAHGERL